MTCRFIDLTQARSSEPRKSSLQIEDGYFRVVGNLPHGYEFTLTRSEALEMIELLHIIVEDATK